MSAPAERAREGEQVGGRYRVEAELGRGGTAHVYRVSDERAGTQLALKKLVVAAERTANLQIMFEREYHTLAQLAHPRIVRVFDYGVDGETPYYTMELLEGADARTTWRGQTVPARQACVLLRDAASALALIHSRRMVHRDVSPRNVWCTPDGRAKLIDFGTLVAMGPQTRIAGTPPYVAPESVYMQPLEARSDLYSLGALAYFLLTNRNAYPAREIGDLREIWQRKPLRPEAIRPELPTALCDLVMSLLSLDPRGRPSSAAEVYERLSAIGELPAEDERLAAQAFLTTPQLIGRDEQSALLRKRLLRASRGRGGTAAIVAPAGLGRSRMLESFVLEAKVAGATVVPVFANAVGEGPFALMSNVAVRLLELMPVLSAAMIDHAPVLGHLSPELHRALGSPALAEISGQERARRAAAALLELVDKACDRRLLVIAIDDVQRADSASLGVLGRLSVASGERSLLLVSTVDAAALTDPPPALERLAYSRDRIELTPLRPSDTHALLGALFGTGAGLDDAASWLHELSQGSPAACMQYAQYLVDQGIARFEHGRWELPERLRDRGLPPTLDAMFEARLSGLSADARALALGLALARDESRSAWQRENPLRIEEFPKLLEKGDGARAFAALDELLRAGIMQQRDNFYVLGQRALVDVLLRVTDREARHAAHLRLARLYAEGGYHPHLAVRQLLEAGEEARARALLGTSLVKMQTQSFDWGAMRPSVSAEIARRALEHWQRAGGSPREGILLRRLLVLTGAVYDWIDARVGPRQIAQLQFDCGLDLLPETDSAQPILQRVIECLQRAQARYDALPEEQRGFAPGDAVKELAAATLPLSGAAVHSHDTAVARSLPDVLEPLRPLSPLIGLLTDACQLAVDRVTGRELGTRILVGADLLLGTTLPEILRLGAAAINLHTQAVEDARYGRQRALDVIDRLAPFTGDDMFLAIHGRWLGYAFRGDAGRAQRFRRQVEVITEDDVWRRKAFLFVEAELCALCGDLIALRRTSDAIAQLAATFPGWQPWLGYARAALHQQRAELPAARAELEAALVLAQPGEHRAWTRLAPAYAELLLQLGDAGAALRECDEMLDAVGRLGLDQWTAVAARRIRALALSARGEHPAAQEALEGAFALAHEQLYGGLPLALLHAARAKIALAAGRMSECAAALEELRGLIELADAPALVHAYEAVREQSSRQLAGSDLPAPLTSSTIVVSQTSTTFSDVRTRLATCNERRERWRQALELVLEDSGAAGGHLFLFDANGLFPAASFPGSADQGTLLMAQHYLETQRDETKTAALETAELIPRRGTASGDEGKIVPALLAETIDGRRILTGVALLSTRAGNVRMPRAALMQAISRCLQSAGDSIPLAIDD